MSYLWTFTCILTKDVNFHIKNWSLLLAFRGQRHWSVGTLNKAWQKREQSCVGQPGMQALQGAQTARGWQSSQKASLVFQVSSLIAYWPGPQSLFWPAFGTWPHFSPANLDFMLTVLDNNILPGTILSCNMFNSPAEGLSFLKRLLTQKPVIRTSV